MKTIKTPIETEKFVCEQYRNGVSAQTIIKEFKISGHTLFKILKRNNVPTNFEKSKDLAFNIIKDFQDLSQTRDSILIKYKISKCKLFRILKDNNIPLREKHRKHFFNQDFFKKIDTPEKAQILGFIYADGCIHSKGSHVSMFLHQEDREYLEQIKTIIEYDAELLYRKARFATKPNNRMGWSQPQYGLTLNSKIIVQDLIKLGLCPRKSWVDLSIPNIPNNLIKFFVLGVLEGDGGMCTMTPYRGDYSHRNSQCVKRSLYWCGCVTLMSEISNFIQQELNIKARISDKARGTIIRSIRYTNFEDVNKIINWLYDGTTLRMKRKFNKSREILAL